MSQPQNPYLTVPEIAEFFGVPSWKIRRLVDSLDVEVQRAARARLIPRRLLGVLASELQTQGWLPAEASDAIESIEVPV